MPALTSEIQSFSFGTMHVQLRVPVLNHIRHSLVAREEAAEEPFPYWAKLWPSAMALCNFIAANPHYISGKKVLELAAGLGLPGILAAQLAAEVTISDYAPGALVLIQSSMELNRLSNVHCRLLNWYSLPSDLASDVLLLSDINYEPSAFEVLYGVLIGFLSAGTTILLATPQRLMAKPFIERLLPYCVSQDELSVSLHDEQTFISVLVLSESAIEWDQAPTTTLTPLA